MRNVLACAGRSGGSTISINKGRRAARRLRIRALGSTGESQSRPDSQLLVIINLPAPYSRRLPSRMVALYAAITSIAAEYRHRLFHTGYQSDRTGQRRDQAAH